VICHASTTTNRIQLPFIPTCLLVSGQESEHPGTALGSLWIFIDMSAIAPSCERLHHRRSGPLPGQRGSSLSWWAHSRSKSRSQGRPSGAALVSGLSLDCESGGKVFALAGSRDVRPRAVFFFSRRSLFSTSSHMGTCGALQRQRFCKSLIYRSFLYSNQSCCAAPNLG
jgi:hypothetical protein